MQKFLNVLSVLVSIMAVILFFISDQTSVKIMAIVTVALSVLDLYLSRHNRTSSNK